MRVNLSMSKEFIEKLKRKAEQYGMGVSEYVRFVLLKEWGKL